MYTTAGAYYIVHRLCCKHRQQVCVYFIFRHWSHELPARHLWPAAQLLRQRETGGGILRSASSSVSDPPDPNPDWIRIHRGQWIRIRIKAGWKCPFTVNDSFWRRTNFFVIKKSLVLIQTRIGSGFSSILDSDSYFATAWIQIRIQLIAWVRIQWIRSQNTGL